MKDTGFYTDEVTGKAYDSRLIKRLFAYVAPHKGLVFVSTFCVLISTAVSLTVPVLVKVGIDRYLAKLYHVYTPKTGKAAGVLPKSMRSGDRILVEGKRVLIRKSALKDLGHQTRKELKERGDLSKTTYYLFPAEEYKAPVGRTLGPYWLVPEGSLKDVPPKTIIKVRGADMRGVMLLALIALCLIAVGLPAGYGHVLAIQTAGQRSMYNLRTHLFSHMQRLSLRFFDRHPVGRLATRVANDIEALNEMFTAVFVSLAKDVVLLSGTIIILFFIHATLALVAISVLPFILALSLLFRKKVRGVYREVRRLLAQLNSKLTEDLNGIKIIQAFNRQAAQRKRFRTTNQAHFSANLRQVVIFGIYRPIVELIGATGVALVLFYGGISVLAGAVSLGDLVVFVFFVRQMFRPIAEMSQKYNIMQRAMAALDRIFKILDQKPELPEPPRPVTLKNPAGKVEFENVYLSYVPEKQVLKDISFTAEPGKSVAIVGPTGAGKTSIVNLLCRFYDPDSGHVRIDGVDLRELSRSAITRNIAIVLQDAFIFSRTVASNIRLSSGAEDDFIERTAEAVQANDFIEALPGGLETKMAERGSTLSTGQKQLICFARALVHEPKILILDEATSSVDPATEKKIQSAIETLKEGRTSILIAHRLSTIEKADEILVLDGGRILERGSHEELLSRRGIYYNLYLLQYKNSVEGAV